MIQTIPYSFNKMAVYMQPSIPGPEPSSVPLTFEHIGDNGTMTITYNKQNAMYSKNDGEWTSTPPTIGQGDKVAISSNYYGDSDFWDKIFTYSTNGDPRLKVYGNIMSVYNWQDTPPKYGLSWGTFMNDSYICDATDLFFPPNTSPGCYTCMFAENNYLTAAPSILPATILVGRDRASQGCYEAMFKDCQNLLIGPTVISGITATATDAMNKMFVNCPKLSTGVQVFVTDIVGNKCCVDMFAKCYYLPWVKVHFTTWDRTSTYGTEYRGWLNNAGTSAVNPTFYKPTSLPVSSGVDYIPQNWTIVDF